MKKYSLIGDPVKGSLSPALFKAAYGGKYPYDLVEGGDFEVSWQRFLDEYSAINVTAPFKELAYGRLLELAKAQPGKVTLSGPAGRMGATNLVVKDKDGLAAYNSDFTGIVVSVVEAFFPGITEEFIREYGESFYIKVHQFFRMNLEKLFKEEPVALVVGCGGAGKAAAVAAAELGFATAVMNRTHAKAVAFASQHPEYAFVADPFSDFKDAVKECNLLIYTLPVAVPQLQELSADDFVSDSGIRKVVLEANYRNPSFDEAALFKLASADAVYVPGKRWLLMQAITGYPMMTGQVPDIEAMSSVFG